MSESKASIPEKALHLRARIKSKKPDFVRQESWRYVRLKENWRRPKGIDNKMRMKIKGWPPTVNVGYRGPKAARGLHPSGFEEILVYNVEDLGKVDPRTQAIRIAHTVGKRKRMQIIQEARKKGITILNVSEAKEEIKETVEEKPEMLEGTEKRAEVEGEVKEESQKNREKRENEGGSKW
jgi:large subunit ribosomal protein L32e